MMNTVKFRLLILLCCGLIACSKKKDPVVEPTKPPQTNLEGIDVKLGMNLVGIITDAKTKQPLKGVAVSDGYSVVQTDEKGVYQLSRASNARFVHYVIPAIAKVQMKDGLPDFYVKIDKQQAIFRQDFALEMLENGIEKDFTLYAIADPQVRTNTDLGRFQKESMVDINNSAKTHSNVYGLMLGDIIYDAPSLLQPMKTSVKSDHIKLFPVIGNHDHLQTTNNDFDAMMGYEDVFGPVNYSFDRGNAHIVVMDDVLYTGQQNYTAGFTEQQIKWLRDDLKFVDKDKLLILAVHIPLRNGSSVARLKDAQALMSEFKEVHVMSGHTHYNENVLVSANTYEHVHGAACGAWWTGTINADGTPNGYGVYQISDKTISNWYYKSTNFDKSYQIRMYPAFSFGDLSGYVTANVWNVDEAWKVEFFENGVETGDMSRMEDYDKAAYQFFKGLGKAEPATPNTSTTWFRRPDHIFHYRPQNASAQYMVKATDRFGNVYQQTQMISGLSAFLNY
ncbi:MAG: calcineurin-like phosphoesterase family protein [Pedobacter sp.]|uniref:calcineurin-like phosphoesterase family protein n=1 Tax=Pedobacter sp. TaxID=1411316 RepID=UPI0028099E8F|nr:calcineurin-like phosphoesterase family protein [Pedobacter sp.]MDQ8004172.1 calcineurin-like phosphoesterase family protein [Pedobacter sp.]